MKIVNAEWEKRNLGVETIEISIDRNDSLSEVEAAVKNPNAQYIVLKIPNDRVDIIFAVQKYGYIFIEGMVHLVNHLKNMEVSKIERRIYDSIDIVKMDSSDIDYLKSEVKDGLFDSDRVYLDSYFSKEQAAQRYINWIDDELGRGTEYYKYVYRGNSIGFFALREIGDGHYTSFLGGVYNAYRNSGLGAVVKGPEFVKAFGAKSIDSYVSTNNIAQIRNLNAHGYEIKEITYTFIRHKERLDNE
ncbi:MAG: hypothetical protein IJM51_01430 [Clostridia bacterium]|nr:hypothetical protein [Clostridia bacterium]